MSKSVRQRTLRGVIFLSLVGLAVVVTTLLPSKRGLLRLDDSGARWKSTNVKEAATDQRSAQQDVRITTPDTKIRPNLTEYDDTIWWQGFYTVELLVVRSWKGNSLCDEEQRRYGNSTLPKKKTLVKIKFPCERQFVKSDIGTGNYVTTTYAIRLVARVMGMDVDIVCTEDDNATAALASNIITPWLTGFFPADGPHYSDSEPSLPSFDKACDNKPLMYALPEIRYEFRRLAVALVGARTEAHRQFLNDDLESHYIVPIPSEPMIPDIQLDDVVTHFRCGDSLITNVPGYEFNRFDAIATFIPANARSIGILTQPFQVTDQVRKPDRKVNLDHCRWLVLEFVDYLQEKFPSTQIHIHNGPNETTALAMARMTMADHIITGISTFSIFAAMATFGTAYLRRPTRLAPNDWMLNEPPLESLADNFVIQDEPLKVDRIGGREVSQMFQEPDGLERIRAWFRGESETL